MVIPSGHGPSLSVVLAVPIKDRPLGTTCQVMRNTRLLTRPSWGAGPAEQDARTPAVKQQSAFILGSLEIQHSLANRRPVRDRLADSRWLVMRR